MKPANRRPGVVILATLETKADEIAYLKAALEGRGMDPRVIDVSLNSGGRVLPGPEKMAAIEQTARQATTEVAGSLTASVGAIVGIGGGTGGEIILRIMANLPFDFPKALVTPLPFDPRFALADNSIVLIPTLADICGLNASLRQVLDNAAGMIAGLCETPQPSTALSHVPSVGITALGATQSGVQKIVDGLQSAGHEATVFHANGFGGAAFVRFAQAGAFSAVVDATCHELTRLLLAGDHVPMPSRFSVAADAGLAQVVLPGGLNFIGLGELSLLPAEYADRKHYQHTGLFTHVQVTEDEMALLAGKLADRLNASTSPVHVIVPTGGFSHQDRPGGVIEAPELRRVFLQTMRDRLSTDIALTTIESHINDAETASVALAALQPHLPDPKDAPHA